MINPPKNNDRRDDGQELTMGSEHTSVLKLAMTKASALGLRVFQNVVGSGWTGKLENSWQDSKAGRCVEISGANFQPFGLLVPSQDRGKLTKNAKGEKTKKRFGGSLDLVGWRTRRIMPEDVPPGGLRVAIFVTIDAKTASYSEMSPDQKHFTAQVIKAGGEAYLARRSGESDAELIPVEVEDHNGRA